MEIQASTGITDPQGEAQFLLLSCRNDNLLHSLTSGSKNCACFTRPQMNILKFSTFILERWKKNIQQDKISIDMKINQQVWNVLHGDNFKISAVYI